MPSKKVLPACAAALALTAAPAQAELIRVWSPGHGAYLADTSFTHRPGLDYIAALAVGAVWGGGSPVAGIWLGTIAALYSICEDMKALVATGTTSVRRKPRLSYGVWP
jgi:hypothetical protein